MEPTDREMVERVEQLMALIGSKWKPAIVFCLVREGPLRFSQLRRAISKVSQKMLTQQLRDLERHGLVARKFYQEIPPRVEYSITDLGLTLDPIFKSVCTWGTKHIAELQHARARYDRTAVKATPSGSS